MSVPESNIYTAYQEAFNIYMTQLPAILKKLNKSHLDRDFFKKMIQNNEKAIFSTCYSEIAEYVKSHDVSLKNGEPDEFKVLYFLGLSLAKHVLNSGYGKEISNIFIFESVMLLNVLFHKKHTSPLHSRETLVKTLLKNIKSSDFDLDKNYGKYGIYLLFKCQSRLIEHIKSSAESSEKI